MAKGGFHHIILMSDGRVTGTVSEYDLFTMQQISIGQLAARINAAESQETIHACAEEIRNLVEYMFVQGVAADQITQIISTFNDQLVKRIIDLETMGEDLGDVRVCWIIMGSEGRHEQTVSTDQDNAAIFDHPGHVSPDEARKLILPIAKRVNQALHAIGIDLCKGNVMAGNPDCCLSLSEWKKKFHAWILEPTPESLLNVTIYFDFRALHGHTDLAHDLRTWLTDAAVDQKRFLHQITEVALEKSPPFTFFNTIIQENHPEVPHSIDIKQSGINVFVDAARIYALALGIPTTRTHERLTLAAGKRSWPENSVIAWTEAFNFLQGVRIRHHLQSKDHKAQNRLDLCKLNDLEQKVCAEAFRQAGKLQKRLRDDFRNNLLHSTFSGA
jgi:CBS domain-containing protein